LWSELLRRERCPKAAPARIAFDEPHDGAVQDAFDLGWHDVFGT
jgi:hypothetical protein